MTINPLISLCFYKNVLFLIRLVSCLVAQVFFSSWNFNCKKKTLSMTNRINFFPPRQRFVNSIFLTRNYFQTQIFHHSRPDSDVDKISMSNEYVCWLRPAEFSQFFSNVWESSIHAHIFHCSLISLLDEWTNNSSTKEVAAKKERRKAGKKRY